jgi:hypothetical protein
MFKSFDFNDPLVCHLFDTLMNDNEDDFFMGAPGKRKLYDSTDDEREAQCGDEEEEEEPADEQMLLSSIDFPFHRESTADGSEKSPSNLRNQEKKNTRKVVKVGYSAANLTNELIKTELSILNDPLLIHAYQELGEVLSLHKSDDSMRFIYGFNLCNREPHELLPTPVPSLSLTILQGSIFTTLFSSIARYDDEYLLELHDLEDHDTTLLWLFKGYLHQSGSVESSELDWTKMKSLQDYLQMNYIGIHSFAKILSQVILSLPLCEREGKRFDPMPATIMYSPPLSCLHCLTYAKDE